MNRPGLCAGRLVLPNVGPPGGALFSPNRPLSAVGVRDFTDVCGSLPRDAGYHDQT
jgi:hypothetical protein